MSPIPMLNRFSLVLFLTPLLVLILASPAAFAFPSIRASFFAAYPDAVGTTIETLTTSTRTNHCGVCHFRFSGGGPRNPYGQLVEATDRSVSSILGLGSLDPDGDGFTNDEEITSMLFGNTPTFPGLSAANVASVTAVDLNEIMDFLTPAPIFVHDEDFDGDLSDDRLLPDAFSLVAGENTLVATQQGNAFGRDIDYFTINVAPGTELSALFIDGFVAEPANEAFLGIQEGTTFTVDAASATAETLLGGIVYGESNLDTNILPAIGTLPGASGFNPPLPSGDYTIWLNQTGPASTVTLTFVVPEPGMTTLLITGVLSIACGSRRGRRPFRGHSI